MVYQGGVLQRMYHKLGVGHMSQRSVTPAFSLGDATDRVGPS